MTTGIFGRNRLPAMLLTGTAMGLCLVVGLDRAVAFRGGFGGFHGGGFGGFHGGGSRFGDGGFADRSGDAGFGRGGFGSVHNAGDFSDHADAYQESHPEFQHNATQLQQNRTNEANTLQQNRTNEANTLQQNRYNEARALQYNRVNTWNNY